MNSRTADRAKHLLNTDVVRRMLIRYFRDKGCTESFNRLISPVQLQDLASCVPVLATKLEVVPHAMELDPALGRAVLGWNLFVLGTHRMYLGETHHYDLQMLVGQLKQGRVMVQEGQLGPARRMSTPRQIVNFVTRVLGRHEAGYVDLTLPPSALQQLSQPLQRSGIFHRPTGFRL